jgi:peroxiredoxin
MNRTTTAAVFLCLAIFCFGPIFAAEVTPLPIGAPAPSFDLPGVDGKNHTLHNYDAAKILIVLFTCNHCPTAQAYEARIKEIYSDYKDRGVALVAINPNNPDAIRLDELGYTDLSDSFNEMKIRAKDHHFEFPYLYDGQTQKVSHAYGVLATPHLFIFDAQRKLRYQGRIDDSDVKQVHHHDARDALDALLAGKPVAVQTTRVFGCSTKWIDKSGTVQDAEKKWSAQPVALSSIDVKGVQELARNDTKNLRVVNVWATWCGPCLAEMPELIKLPQMYSKRGFELVMISADEPEKKDRALAVLKENHVAATNYIVNSDDHDALADALDKQWPGPLPHTLVIAPGGKVIYRHTGALDPLELKQAIVGYLGRTY